MLISMRGNHPALDLEPGEADEYTFPDGVYYGRVLDEKPGVYACLPGRSSRLDRVCGESTDDCFLEVMGLCKDVCDEDGCLDSEGNLHPQVIHVFLSTGRDTTLCNPGLAGS